MTPEHLKKSFGNWHLDPAVTDVAFDGRSEASDPRYERRGVREMNAFCCRDRSPLRCPFDGSVERMRRAVASREEGTPSRREVSSVRGFCPWREVAALCSWCRFRVSCISRGHTQSLRDDLSPFVSLVQESPVHSSSSNMRDTMTNLAILLTKSKGDARAATQMPSSHRRKRSSWSFSDHSSRRNRRDRRTVSG